MNSLRILFALIVVLFLGLLICGASEAQTPPVSEIAALPDTAIGDSIALVVEVRSDLSWDSQRVGVYWTTDYLMGWNYAGSTRDTLIWSFPSDHSRFYFSSTVDDDFENSEGYEFEIKAETFACSDCIPADCPDCPLSLEEAQTLTITAELASRGFELEPDEPGIYWHWTAPLSGSKVAYYAGEWDVGGIISVIDSIPGPQDYSVGDTISVGINLPYVWGSYQTIRVRGIDHNHRSGPFSNWGDPWIDDGPPGEIPAPESTLQMR